MKQNLRKISRSSKFAPSLLMSALAVLLTFGCSHSAKHGDSHDHGHHGGHKCSKTKGEGEHKCQGHGEKKAGKSKGCCGSAEEVVTTQLSSGLTLETLGQLSFSAQPKTEDFSTLAKLGYTNIVDLRTAKEIAQAKKNGFDEATLTKKSGLNYIHHPVPQEAALQSAAYANLEKLVHAQTGENKTLVHCGSGDKAKAFLAQLSAPSKATDPGQ